MAQFSARFTEAFDDPADGDHVIDLDVVADAVGADDKPPFYYAEESQQNKFKCRECGCLVDILGRYGYCGECGTRNDLQELETKTAPALRSRVNNGDDYAACVKDAVATFDSFASQYMKQLIRHIPMTSARKNRFDRMRFHDLDYVCTELRAAFDIDILNRIGPEDSGFAKLMFHRRHVYEHNGGEADAKYIADSGDDSVRLKQVLRETRESAHRIIGIVLKMAANLHEGFHQIFPPEERPIMLHKRYPGRS